MLMQNISALLDARRPVVCVAEFWRACHTGGVA
jgi:hypothetical protein